MSNSNNWQSLVKRPSKDFPRTWLPSRLDFSDWKQVQPWVEDLTSDIPDKSSLKRWLDNYAELLNAWLEEGARLYIDMTCSTRDRGKEKAYLHFINKIEPRQEQFRNDMRKKVHVHPLKHSLGVREHGRWLNSISTQLKLFKEKNLPLQAETSRLSQGYQKICGSLAVKWKGKTVPIKRLNPVLEGNNREQREKAWRMIARCYQDQRASMDKVFNRLFVVRNRIAANLGLRNYRDYCFKHYERTDYSPRDCFAFHRTVEKVVVPMYRDMLERRRNNLGLKTLRPWDLNCDEAGRPPLKPFKGTDALIRGVDNILKKLDPELQTHFKTMRRKKLLDLDSRMGKAPGGYQCSLDEVRLPFIFMNSVDSGQDIFTLLHEFGHSFHHFQSAHRQLSYNREPSMEFAEVASMGMERMGMRHLDTFYGPEEMARAIAAEDEEVFRLLTWVAAVDNFQHWMYTRPEHTPGERNGYWQEVMERFGCGVDWSGLQTVQRSSWHRQLHIFEYPFYYIEYGIAQLGALQLWQHFRRNSGRALADYKNALSFGGTLGLKQLFSKAGLTLDFSPKTVEPLVKKVYREWEELS